MNDMTRLQVRLGLSPAAAKILALLVNHEVVTAEMLEDELKVTKVAKVAVHRLRQRLAGSPIEVKSRRDLGYWMDPATRESIKSWLGSDEIELVLDGGADNALSTFPQRVS